MSIMLAEGHREVAEAEFAERHPDVFSTYLAAFLVERLAEAAEEEGMLGKYRCDLNLQTTAQTPIDGVTPININIGGQLIVPDSVDLEKIAEEAAIDLLERAGYFRDGDFSPDRVALNLEGITAQSSNINGITDTNSFADSCVVYGHYIAPPFGINGTFPSLAIAQQIDRARSELLRECDGLRPDGKVHVMIRYTAKGFVIEHVNLSTSHARSIDNSFRGCIKEGIKEKLKEFSWESTVFDINYGGDFDIYFVQADAGVSKAKDDVIITGGIHQLGTDRVWGKCLFKASSTVLPYVFALSRVVCDATGAEHSSVEAYTNYGREDLMLLQLDTIDPEFEWQRSSINHALKQLPDDRDGIREIAGCPVTIETYRLFNDVGGFHHPDKPWKKRNKVLEDEFRRYLS